MSPMNSTKPTSIAVIGASGYTGMEMIRYLQGCPQFELKTIVGNRTAGLMYSTIYPAFSGIVDLVVQGPDSIRSLSTDAVVLALPHGQSMQVVKQLLDSGYQGKIVDMGSDFRLKSSAEYQNWYKKESLDPSMLSKSVYGLIDFNEKLVKNANLVANPGCFASAIQLGLLPLLEAGIGGPFHITGLTGASGSGVSPSAGTHFPVRDGNIKAYKVLEHQHLGEVFGQIESSGFDRPEIIFTPVSAPITRGIWISISFLSGGMDLSKDLVRAFERVYAGKSLVRLRSGLPNLKDVTGTAFTDVGWVERGDAAVVGVAIDNLGKGAAGQAIQNLNVMFGYPDDMRLKHVGNVI